MWERRPNERIPNKYGVAVRIDEDLERCRRLGPRGDINAAIRGQIRSGRGQPSGLTPPIWIEVFSAIPGPRVDQDEPGLVVVDESG